MTPDDAPIVSFPEFLDTLDRPTASYGPPPTRAEWEAHRRGQFLGEWYVLWQLAELEHRGQTDVSTARRMIEAGLIAMKKRRSSLDFWHAMERVYDNDTDYEGIYDGDERAPDEDES